MQAIDQGGNEVSVIEGTLFQHLTRMASTRHDDECWVWPGAHTRGRGVVSVNGKLCYAARIGYEQRYGPVPNGLELDHICKDKGCYNPDHLEPRNW